MRQTGPFMFFFLLVLSHGASKYIECYIGSIRSFDLSQLTKRNNCKQCQMVAETSNDGLQLQFECRNKRVHKIENKCFTGDDKMICICDTKPLCNGDEANLNHAILYLFSGTLSLKHSTTASDSRTQDPSESWTGIAIGFAAGGLVLLVLLTIVVFICIRKRRKKRAIEKKEQRDKWFKTQETQKAQKQDEKKPEEQKKDDRLVSPPQLVSEVSPRLIPDLSPRLIPDLSPRLIPEPEPRVHEKSVSLLISEQSHSLLVSEPSEQKQNAYI